MSEAIIRVPVAAKVEQEDYQGIPVKEAYWTAGYEEGSTVRHAAPLNHGMTFVLDGKTLGLSDDILLREGNGFINLAPKARTIVSVVSDGTFTSFTTVDLAHEEQLLRDLGVFEANETAKKIGLKAHYDRMELIRTMLERQ